MGHWPNYANYQEYRMTEQARDGQAAGMTFDPVAGAIVTNTPRHGETPEQIDARFNRMKTRTFATGATRDTDENKLDFEGFLSPLVLEEFAKYMHAKRKMPDGSMRDSDNWQKGIPVEAYMKSMFRHFFAVWRSYRRDNTTRDAGHDYSADIEELLALLFNVQGMTHELLKEAGKR